MPLHEYLHIIYGPTTMTTPSAHQNATQTPTKALELCINSAYDKAKTDWTPEEKEAISLTLQLLDQGKLRICEKIGDTWQHHPWLQKAILCYMKSQDMTQHHNNFLYYQDKVPSKFSQPTANKDFRIVPPTHVRYGAHIGKNCVLMPCFVNIGAYIDAETMVDTWATVGSGAQIGKKCHISGGAGIGGVLEPPQAKPTIIEDHCFIGARSEIAEGVIVRKGAVLAMGTFISQSTKIYDRTQNITYTGEIPENAVVVPGSIPSADQTHATYAAIIVKYADEKTRQKTSINEILRT
jgi:2,3,4,5-tetrahydropyridine-2-carboxylate N-succinyltransferase